MNISAWAQSNPYASRVFSAHRKEACSMAEKGQKRKRGFALLDPERRTEIARLGGRTAHGRGTGYTFTQEEQRKGGERGGRTVSQNRAYMAEIGRRGGMKSPGRPAKVKADNSKAQ